MAFDATNTLDKTFFEGVLQESIKIFGISVEYWQTDYNQNKDRIFSDDTKPLIIAKYPMKVMGEIIQEDWLLTRFGLGSNDFVNLQIDKKEFAEIVGKDAIPKSGDYLWIQYMNRLFIITDVDQEEAVFLQQKFSYTLRCKAADISGEEISTTISSDITSANYEITIDNSNDNDYITQALSGVVKEKSNDRSIFGDYD